METLRNYKPYDLPRVGVFTVHKEPAEYKLPGGWVHVQVEGTIIGEADDCYVERLLNTGHGEWVGKKVIQYKYILPIGFHKSRLIKWLS